MWRIGLVLRHAKIWSEGYKKSPKHTVANQISTRPKDTVYASITAPHITS
jgi:hypothetical protein